MSISRDERRRLCALLDETGPDAPTLCAGWTTGDLAAHLVLRERRPDAAAGMWAGRWPGTPRGCRADRRRTPFPDLVQTIQDRAAAASPFALPGMDERANLAEYFVHHEDVRRAAPGWQPRELAAGLTDELWQRLRRRGSCCARRRSAWRSPATTRKRTAAAVADHDQERDAGRDRGGGPAELTLWVSVERLVLPGSGSTVPTRRGEQAHRDELALVAHLALEPASSSSMYGRVGARAGAAAG